jgi:hypothetical protein
VGGGLVQNALRRHPPHYPKDEYKRLLPPHIYLWN